MIMKKYHIRTLDFVVSLFLAFAIPAATTYLSQGSLQINFSLVLQMLATFIALIFSVILIRTFFSHLANSNLKSNSKLSRGLNRLFNSKHRTLWLALIIFLCWVPALVMLYPGTLINDSWGQLNQVLNLREGTWAISAHHPVFDTALMSVIILPIEGLFDNWHIAFFVYVLIQAICTSLVFAYSISYFKDKFKQKNLTSFIFLLIYCFFPIFVMSVQTVSKDALFAWVYLLFAIQFIEILRTKGACLKNHRFLISLLVVCIFCILTKKAGAFILLGSLVLAFFFIKGYRRYFLIPITAILGFNFIILPAVRYTFYIEESGTQEMLSLPFQQTARYVKEHGDEVTKDEKETLEKVLEYQNLAAVYDPINADLVKGYEPRGEKSDYVNYLKVWLSQGLKHPETYLSATGAHLSGWFSYSLYMPLTNMNWHNQQNDHYIPESATERNSFFSATSTAFENIYRFIYSIPGVGLLLTFAFLATLAPFFILTTLLERRKTSKYLLATVPLFLSLILGCYLAPVSAGIEGMRYLYPVTYSLPTLFMLAISLYDKSVIK